MTFTMKHSRERIIQVEYFKSIKKFQENDKIDKCIFLVYLANYSSHSLLVLIAKL